MAYLKGGTVVDGNLYVEGNLNIRGQSSEEGVRYAYILNPGAYPNNIIKIRPDNSGELIPTSLVEEVIDGDTKITNQSGDLVFNMYPGIVTFEGPVEDPSANRNLLRAYDSNNNLLIFDETTGLPNGEVAYWKYDTTRLVHLTGKSNGSAVDYTINAEDHDIYVGETVTIEGSLPNNGD